MKRNKSFRIALGGICLALAVVTLFGASFIPGIELTLFAVSSLFTAIMIIEAGTGSGLLVFAGAALLAFAVIPNKAALIPYVCLFGYYPVLKFYIEKIKSGVAQISVKTVYFAALMAVFFLFLSSLISGIIHTPDYPAALLIVLGTAMMLLYDLVLTFLINWYMNHFKGTDPSIYKLS